MNGSWISSLLILFISLITGGSVSDITEVGVGGINASSGEVGTVSLGCIVTNICGGTGTHGRFDILGVSLFCGAKLPTGISPIRGGGDTALDESLSKYPRNQ